MHYPVLRIQWSPIQKTPQNLFPAFKEHMRFIGVAWEESHSINKGSNPVLNPRCPLRVPPIGRCIDHIEWPWFPSWTVFFNWFSNVCLLSSIYRWLINTH